MSTMFAKRIENMKASAIREILKVTEEDGFISFAGGLPAPELFPVEEMQIVSKTVLDECGNKALQYTTTEGYLPLREQIVKRMNTMMSTNLCAGNIQIVSGSQQALDMSGKLFLDEDDVVLCETPTYLGAINAFKAYGCRFVEVPCDEEGMIVEELKRIISQTDRIKLMYVIPDFQNPTGISWSLERRKAFMQVINQHNIPVIEDNPYGELTFTGEVKPSLKVWDERGNVITLGTFSKIFCPGLRVAWIAASEELIAKYVILKQSTDLHTSNISQREISKYMDMYDIEAHVLHLREVYKQRRDLALSLMEEMMPEGVKYTRPEGGLFLWVTLPEYMDANSLLCECVKQKVAIVPGKEFFPNGGGENTFRFNFSNASEEQMYEGIKRLTSVIKSYMKMECKAV